jgi:SET domain-containing protein
MLAPSQIHGVGVFAVGKIEVGFVPFTEQNVWIIISGKELESLSTELQVLVKHYGVQQKNGEYKIPTDFRHICLSAYLNHSINPNIDAKEFVALRNIMPGEELTIDYNKLS